MNRCLEELLRERRSRYKLSKEISLSKEQIIELIKETVTYVPSAFNSQSTRLVLLLGDSHRQFWQIVTEAIGKIVSPETFEKSRRKIEIAFSNGYGTVLFFEDETIVDELKKEHPLYANDFPAYSERTSAMNQMVLWLLFTEYGIGTSLQHYSALIEMEVKNLFAIPEKWSLIAQMPFGKATDTPPEKNYLPIEEKFKIFE